MSAAERTGLAGVLEDFILSQACADADALTAAYGLDVPVHVNVSARRLARPDLHAVIDWALGRYKLAASRLVIEVANANRIEDAVVASRAIQRIRDRGVRVAIDDFGSGYDIMTQLQGLPVDLIKLDARITGAGVDATRTEAMCQAVLDVCQRIGLTVIAQGIATAEQAVALRGMGCQARAGRVVWAGAEVAAGGEGEEAADRELGTPRARGARGGSLVVIDLESPIARSRERPRTSQAPSAPSHA